MKEKIVLVSTSVVFKKNGNKPLWFLVNQSDGQEWELPRTLVRRGESSVRASIRCMAEQGGMRAQVLEEVGRFGGATKVNGKAVNQRTLYYLMLHREGSEVLGFAGAEWLDYPKALKKLSSKRDQTVLTQAQEMYKGLDKARTADEPVEDDVELASLE